MKKLLRTTTALCGLMLAVPTVGYAAEAAPKAPVAVATETNLVQRGEKQFVADKMTITETVANSFSETGKIVLTAKNMEFEMDGKGNFSKDGVKGSYAVEDKKLVVSVEDSDKDKLESITLEGIKVTPDGPMWDKGTYSLYAVLEDGNKIVVDDDFVTVIDRVRPSKEYLIELKLNEKTVKVNGVQKDLRVSAYISDRGYTMLPIREIVEVFPNTSIEWNNDTKKAIVFYKTDIAEIVSGKDEMHINGERVWMREKAEVKDGRTFLSIRDVCRICNIPNHEVKWDAETKTVTIDTIIEDGWDGMREDW